VPNTLAYYDVAMIKAVKCLVYWPQVPGSLFAKVPMNTLTVEVSYHEIHHNNQSCIFVDKTS
jgi:hypothetical protein